MTGPYQWGTGDEFNPTSTEGLLSMVGYSRRYFDRFDEELAPDVDLPTPEAVLDKLGEDTTMADDYDAAMVLTNGNLQVLLGAEQALRGEFDELNGVGMEGSFDSVFEIADRRTAFIGVGLPAEQLDVEAISENSPTAMGFRSSFEDNQATEDRVAIPYKPFADATTMQLSRLTFGLEEWYNESKERRIDLMFSKHHTEEDIGEIGELLSGDSRISEEQVEKAGEDAAEGCPVGHTQKVAAARDSNFEPTLLRRSEGVSTDLAEPAMNFISLQREMGEFIDVRHAMNGEHIDAEIEPADDGIEDYTAVRSRATFLVPPRSHRALPTPQPSSES